MTGVRQAIMLGAIPIVVGLAYLVIQLALGDPTVWALVGLGENAVASISGTVDAAGVVLLVALGFAMGFGMLVILRGARDL